MQLKDIAEEMQQRSMAARDWVFQVLRTAIIRGVLPGGMPLRQDEISAQLSVSHIPVREAFRQLDAQGLVRIYPNRGAVVTKLTREELENAMDTRIILEMGAIRAAIPLMTDECIEKAAVILQECETETDANKLEDLNLQFHFALYEATGNTFLLQLIDSSMRTWIVISVPTIPQPKSARSPRASTTSSLMHVVRATANMRRQSSAPTLKRPRCFHSIRPSFRADPISFPSPEFSACFRMRRLAFRALSDVSVIPQESTTIFTESVSSRRLLPPARSFF